MLNAFSGNAKRCSVPAGAHRAGCKVRQYPGNSTSSAKLPHCHSCSAPIDSQALCQQQNYTVPALLRHPGVCIGAHQCWHSLRRADCSCSAFTAQGSLLLLSRKEKKSTEQNCYGQLAQRRCQAKGHKSPGCQKRHVVLPQEVLSRGAKPEQFPVGAAPNEVQEERTTLMSRCKRLAHADVLASLGLEQSIKHSIHMMHP